MKKILFGLLALGMSSLPAQAADYVIDTKGAHAFVQFRVQHLGYSWLYGRFNDFEGRFSYDEKAPEKASVSVTIDTASLDSNHAERDKHLRSPDFFDVKKYPQAKFASTAYRETGEGRGQLSGNLTLHGTTRPITIDVQQVGAGEDPWGGYRRGFQGSTTITPADFGMDYDLGPASSTVELILSVEGIRQ
ncbi:MAG: YceI family protein [Gammaproteobacteria bacterium]|nr:YceI family protein [Gammaproteobacteria bacterium]MCW8840799.1 YceI family protein [Gammaproteobacteria bacterium]MCW8958826.1 YceI family protein [Gammaproteobacteria bacterium]MCW8972024.1 YceI family protein [Gammaproteobacteria bacterium]MCW8991935.1 YceI family protein [Gammaproteobacteria bacterium]